MYDLMKNCPLCGLSYTSAPEYFRHHRKYHKEIAISYDNVMKRYHNFSRPVPWKGRPSKQYSNEHPGTYLALNALNPRMIGFREIGGLELF